ncbi:FAD-binding protein [Candidatus Levibacter sp. Uisw_134_01]|uniref:electron transfer flavoprotein subunit alpha/FixB family protein n=1 Tax=Candidatus Levibacter sp. Uisw_134_01 TaxID=3230999 RepID=UPI003D4346D4
MSILVIVEHNNNELLPATLHTVNAAKQIGNTDVLVIGNNCQTVIESTSKIEGINEVLFCDEKIYENPLAEDTSILIHSIAKKYTHVLFSNTANGKNTAPRLAALLDVMIIPDVIEIIDIDTFKRPIYAGNAIATCKSNDNLKILTIRTTAFEKAIISDKETKTTSIKSGEKTTLSKYINSELSKNERPELTAADIVVSGGRGLGSSENFQVLEKLADKLGAAMGASRAAVDAGYVPNDWQVGQTGKVVAPNLYIAAGISGAIQHLAGMKDSKVIVAINKDEEAPIFTVSDYGLSEDLFKAVPEMEKLIK